MDPQPELPATVSNVSMRKLKIRLQREHKDGGTSQKTSGIVNEDTDKTCVQGGLDATDYVSGATVGVEFDDHSVPEAIIDKWLSNFNGLQPDSYWFTRIVLLRAISFLYLVAFLVAYHQNKQLIGDRGLLPLRAHMAKLNERFGEVWFGRFAAAPTLIWLAEPWDKVDPWLDAIALSGATVAAVILLYGAANFFMMAALWVLYHSLVAVGQCWYGFGWESQLLETGLLITWCVSFLSVTPLPASPPSYVTIYGLRWLLFRIMLGAGLIKIRGDSCWMDLTCMNYHYQTQPVPNPLSYYLHHTPTIVHKVETAGNHVVELLVPWLAGVGGRSCLLVCAAVQISFQVMLILSGNLSFLNWLTIVPSLALLDDRVWSRFFSRSARRTVARLQVLAEKEHPKVQAGLFRDAFNLLLTLGLAYLSLPVMVNLLSSRQAMNLSYDPFRIVNTYGAFGSVTKVRHEVVLEGLSHHNNTWLEYNFKCKPDDVDARPCLISPYHYRLDWLMWFAAMHPAEQNPWLFHLCYKLLANDKAATDLMLHNPFLGVDPPISVRAVLYKYEFTRPFSNTTAWYSRTVVHDAYIRPLTNASLQPIVTEMGWG